MGKFDKINVGEKLPGTYCPVCGEVGLRKVKDGGDEWAMCPMDAEMNATVELKDAHTGFKLDPREKPTVPAAPKAALAKPETEKENKGVDDA